MDGYAPGTVNALLKSQVERANRESVDIQLCSVTLRFIQFKKSRTIELNDRPIYALCYADDDNAVRIIWHGKQGDGKWSRFNMDSIKFMTVLMTSNGTGIFGGSFGWADLQIFNDQSPSDTNHLKRNSPVNSHLKY